MSEPLNLNRERIALLRAIQGGHVERSAGGHLMRRVRAGQNLRVERKVRELREAGLVERLTLKLTADGETAIGGGQP